MEKKKCIVCGQELTGAKKMYCSNSCKQKHHYLKVKDNPNTCHAQTIRGLRRKMKLIDYKGGKCEICGYDKNIAALDFHHLDSSLKEFQLDARKLSNTNWETILKEADKCVLVCSNCHREIHNPEYTKEYIESLKTFSEMNKEEIIHTKHCAYCGNSFNKSNHNIFCSKSCKEKAKAEYFSKYPTLDDVNSKYAELHSWEKVAEYYSLTRKIIQGIRKRVQISGS